jgi:hypothetical protein
MQQALPVTGSGFRSLSLVIIESATPGMDGQGSARCLRLSARQWTGMQVSMKLIGVSKGTERFTIAGCDNIRSKHRIS